MLHLAESLKGLSELNACVHFMGNIEIANSLLKNTVRSMYKTTLRQITPYKEYRKKSNLRESPTQQN